MVITEFMFDKYKCYHYQGLGGDTRFYPFGELTAYTKKKVEEFENRAKEKCGDDYEDELCNIVMDWLNEDVGNIENAVKKIVRTTTMLWAAGHHELAEKTEAMLMLYELKDSNE